MGSVPLCGSRCLSVPRAPPRGPLSATASLSSRSVPPPRLLSLCLSRPHCPGWEAPAHLGSSAAGPPGAVPESLLHVGVEGSMVSMSPAVGARGGLLSGRGGPWGGGDPSEGAARPPPPPPARPAESPPSSSHPARWRHRVSCGSAAPGSSHAAELFITRCGRRALRSGPRQRCPPACFSGRALGMGGAGFIPVPVPGHHRCPFHLAVRITGVGALIPGWRRRAPLGTREATRGSAVLATLWPHPPRGAVVVAAQ